VDAAVQDRACPREAGPSWTQGGLGGEKTLDGTEEGVLLLGAEPRFAKQAEAGAFRRHEGQGKVGAAHIGGQDGTVSACNHGAVNGYFEMTRTISSTLLE
jgi:hypothetical protein